MSNVTVQEALKAAIEALEDAGTHTVFSYEATINECKAALSEIDKCEPDAEVYETAVYPNSDGMYEHRFLFPDRLAQQTELYLYNPNEPQPREECEPVAYAWKDDKLCYWLHGQHTWNDIPDKHLLMPLYEKPQPRECEPVAEVNEQWVIDFIGSNYNSMRTHDEQGNELELEDITYSLTVHDLLSAFAYTSINPVAYRYKEDGYWVYTEIHQDKFNSHALYDKLQPRDWVYLSDIDKAECASHTSKLGVLGAVNATEAKCKQLNTKG